MFYLVPDTLRRTHASVLCLFYIEVLLQLFLSLEFRQNLKYYVSVQPALVDEVFISFT